MIDCSKAEIGAIREAFGQNVSVLLCHWHIKRAWEKKIKSDIKVNQSTIETTRARTSTRIMLNNLMYAPLRNAISSNMLSLNINMKANSPAFLPTLILTGIANTTFG
jgi:hypothetical protein